MIRFNNDYNHGAHPEILEALSSRPDPRKSSLPGCSHSLFPGCYAGELYRDRQCAFFCSECDCCRYRTY